MPCFNHEVAPSYLRTKPEPGVEEKMAQLITRSSQLTQESVQVKNVVCLGLPDRRCRPGASIPPEHLEQAPHVSQFPIFPFFCIFPPFLYLFTSPSPRFIIIVGLGSAVSSGVVG